MHCPDCGSEALADQRFCRACGLSLERFAQLLAELRSESEDENAALKNECDGPDDSAAG
jgi:hypothetical protein